MTAEQPRVNDLRDRFARGGAAWTMLVNQSVGAWIVRWALPRKVKPSTLTVAYGLLGIGTSAGGIFLATVNRPAAAAALFVGWQLAYSLDCADGQLARARGTGSPSGALLDSLTDFLFHASVALTLVPIAVSILDSYELPVAVVLSTGNLASAYFAGLIALSPAAAPASSKGVVATTVRSIRDFGFYSFVAAVGLALGPEFLLGALCLVSALDLAAVLVGIAKIVRRDARIAQ